MLTQLRMPKVSDCEATECFYNVDKDCHAPAINVGGNHPECDTYIANGAHVHGRTKALVGACHVGNCEHNKDLSCHAKSIHVRHHAGHADCTTYAPQ
ncbi:DUF1540 domain-containing protein [Vulgatibacter sp.]|uniref:DUF1540 domain-containing protein n=1 Tax=Vulgatibacter sp. TaxID=1971226 RepID=UPI00356708E5